MITHNLSNRDIVSVLFFAVIVAITTAAFVPHVLQHNGDAQATTYERKEGK